MKSFAGLNKYTLIAIVALTIGIVSLTRYIDDGDEYSYEYLKTSSEVIDAVGNPQRLSYTKYRSAKDHITGLFYKQYTYTVLGNKAGARVKIRLYYESSHKQSNSDIVKVTIESIKMI